MDGNGRWARERGLRREQGHSKGADSVRTIVRACRRIGVDALTLFAFSSQNWDRPPREVFHLMHLLRRYLIEERSEILDNDIRLVTVGETSRLPRMVLRPLRELIEASAHNRGMTLCLALSYGGRETIASAAQQLARAVARGEVDPKDIEISYIGKRAGEKTHEYLFTEEEAPHTFENGDMFEIKSSTFDPNRKENPDWESIMPAAKGNLIGKAEIAAILKQNGML